MEDIEAIAQGIRRPYAAPRVLENDHLKLSPEERPLAARVPNSSEYNFILRILEGELEKLETEHMRTWKDKDLFERTGIVAVAARTLYERLQIEMNYHASMYEGELEAAVAEQSAAEMTPEEFIRKSFGMEE